MVFFAEYNLCLEILFLDNNACDVHSHHDHFWYLSGDCRHTVVTMSSIRSGLTEQDLRARYP